MASIVKINRLMREQQVDEELINKIIGDDNDIYNVIDRMDDYLAPETRNKIIDLCACCTKTSKGRDKCSKEYGKAAAGKTLEEKISGISSIGFGEPILNEDGTITTGIYWRSNGVYNCSCTALKGRDLDRIMSLTYCICCAGHFRYHYQNAFGVKLKTKEVVSSPINSKGEKPCVFVFEIIA